MQDTIDGFWSKFTEYANKASLGGTPILFRGVTQEKNHKLIPSIGRDTSENTNGDISHLEDSLLSEFKRLSITLLNKYPSSDFEWLFLAQHYGLPTRLLDWSTNPLVALFFSVEKDDDYDAALHIVSHQVSDQYELFDFKTANVKSEIKNNRNEILNIFSIQSNQGKVIFVRPKYTDQRYLNQKSIFSCHADPFKDLDLPDQVKLTIKKEWKHIIRQRLGILGLSHSYIYPGLDGVATEIKSQLYNPVQSGKMKIISMTATLSL